MFPTETAITARCLRREPIIDAGREPRRNRVAVTQCIFVPFAASDVSLRRRRRCCCRCGYSGYSGQLLLRMMLTKSPRTNESSRHDGGDHGTARTSSPLAVTSRDTIGWDKLPALL
jgi:hypothetical protein